MPGLAAYSRVIHNAETPTTQTGDDEDPAGAAVPRTVAAPDAGDELERTDHREHRGADDVGHQRRREAGVPGVGRHQVGAAAELQQPEDAGRERDDAQGEQGRRDRPAPRLGGRPSLLDGHRTGLGSAWAVDGAVGAAWRWLSQSETPRPIIAMPLGKASSR